jgi:copper(I)-binding protein
MDLQSAEGDRLVSASVPTDIAGKTEIHETVTGEGADSMDGEGADSMDGMDDNGMEGDSMGGDPSSHGADGGMEGDAMMGMRQLEDGLELPAGVQVSLEPGGFHIMLLELKTPIAEGDTIPVTLTFEKAGEVEVDAQAREA